MFPFLLSGRFHISKHELLRGSRRSITFTKFLDFQSPCAACVFQQQLHTLSGNTTSSARGLKQRIARVSHIRLVRTAMDFYKVLGLPVSLRCHPPALLGRLG